MSWAFPSLQAQYRTKPDSYVEVLMGHEGKGSLLSLLKRKGWATGLSAGAENSGECRNTASWIFEVNWACN